MNSPFHEAKLRAFGDHEVRCVGSGNVFGAVIAEIRCVDTFQKGFSGTEEDRRQRQMHFVDKPGAKVLPDRGDTAAEPDVLTVRSVNRAFQCGVDAIGDKVEGRAAGHLNRWAWVVGEHENRSMVRRIVSPPSFPRIVWPGATDWSKHVSADDPGADIGEAACGKVVVDTRGAALFAMHLLEGAGGEDPFVQRQAADANWVGEILMGAGTVAVEGDRKAVDAKPGHD